MKVYYEMPFFYRITFLWVGTIIDLPCILITIITLGYIQLPLRLRYSAWYMKKVWLPYLKKKGKLS